MNTIEYILEGKNVGTLDSCYNASYDTRQSPVNFTINAIGANYWIIMLKIITKNTAIINPC